MNAMYGIFYPFKLVYFCHYFSKKIYCHAEQITDTVSLWNEKLC